jgi:hypothetical protein
MGLTNPNLLLVGFVLQKGRCSKHTADEEVVEFGSGRGNDDLSGKVACTLRMTIL